jgi:selenocysteine-specific elongation factor
LKQIILGTAGHIDHGKTSLIKAVTGTDTDRLKEEKLRGITIELGFASMDLPGGDHLGIVDVPGHEKFVKNMVAGATGIDIVAMVIAADEGVMPQTREHMEICSLLDVQHGLVALTKTDMVDEEWMELVLEDVREFTAGTFLEDVDIVPVSSVTGEGIDQFISALEKLSREIPDRRHTDLFRLPVDRVFTMKGFGTVITGSLIAGKVNVGDTIEIYPTGVGAKVRGIQVHNLAVEQAESGMRTAINLQGVEKASINRGDILADAGALVSNYMVDVSFNYLNSNKKPLKNRTRVRFHTGTSEILGYLILLDREELAPGEPVAAQMRLDAPVALVRDDRFVIRSYSPIRTIGGGKVINPIPAKHKRFRPESIKPLEQLRDADAETIITLQLENAGYVGISFGHLKLMTNLPDKPLANKLQDLLSHQIVVLVDKENRIYTHNTVADNLRSEILEQLDKFHHKHPLKPGMLKEELKSKFPHGVSPKLINLVINRMVKENDIVLEEKTMRLAGHKISLAGDQAEVRGKIIAAYRDGRLMPPYFKELINNFKLDPGQAKDVLMLLVDEGQVIKVKEDLYFDAAAVEALKKELVEFLKSNGEITTPRFKDMTGASRKYVIPLAEYFDARNVTLRIGDIRKLRKG